MYLPVGVGVVATWFLLTNASWEVVTVNWDKLPEGIIDGITDAVSVDAKKKIIITT